MAVSRLDGRQTHGRVTNNELFDPSTEASNSNPIRGNRVWLSLALE
jgi:hypothetical protein